MPAPSLILLLLLCPPLWADDAPPPSLELLEFLADFGDIDRQTLELMEYHAQKDLLRRSTAPDEQAPQLNEEDTSNED